MAVQIQRPVADVLTVGWSPTPGSPSTAFDKVDEIVADDADYVSSAPAPDGSDPLELELSTVSDPLSSDDHIFRYRIRKSAAGGAQVDMLVELVEGTTVIESWNHVDISNDWTTHEQTLGATEADSITDYSDLRLRFTPTQV